MDARPSTVASNPMDHPGSPDAADLAYHNEVRRKLLHLLAVSIPIGYHLVSWPTASVLAGIGFLISLFVDVARFRGWRIQQLWHRWTSAIVRPKERLNFTGATNILLSAWLCPLMFSLPAAAMGMSAIILGDIAAALVGRRWGRHRYAGNRTIEGSAAFLGAASVGALIIPGIPLGLGLSAALLATIVEAVSHRIDDNLTVPLVTGLFLHLALRVFGAVS